jgi:hypothetical protein
VVNVRVAVPVKFAGGVQLEESELTLEKAPPMLEDHEALEAAPPILPFKDKLPFIHTPFGYTPALAVAKGLNNMVVGAETA